MAGRKLWILRSVSNSHKKETGIFPFYLLLVHPFFMCYCCPLILTVEEKSRILIVLKNKITVILSSIVQSIVYHNGWRWCSGHQPQQPPLVYTSEPPDWFIDKDPKLVKNISELAALELLELFEVSCSQNVARVVFETSTRLDFMLYPLYVFCFLFGYHRKRSKD